MATVEELATELAALRLRLEATEGVLAIHALKARYADLVDRRFCEGAPVDVATMDALATAAAELFTEDGVWDGGPTLGRVTGRAAIAERLARPTLTFSRHLFVKPEITVDGDRATGRWDLLSPCRTPEGTSYWMCGFEDDEYVRTGSGWLHASMRLTTVFMAPVGGGWTDVFA